MRYPDEQFKILVNKLPALIKALGIMPFKNIQAQKSTAFLHDLHFKMYAQLNYPNDNLNVMNEDGQQLRGMGGKRLFEINTAFKLYPAGCQDSHIETAMKNALKRITQ